VQLVTFDAHPEDTSTRAGHRTLSDGTLGLEALDFAWPGRNRLGVLIPSGPQAGDVVDLNRALAVKLAYEDVSAPEVEADSLLPADLKAFLEHGSEARTLARSTLDFTLDALGRYDGPDLVRAGVVVSNRSVALRAPIARPGKVIGVARNYAAHAAEQGQQEPPKEPVLFIKAATTVIGPNQDIVIPRACAQVDYEGELGVVIGSRTRNVERHEALACVAGYLPANDVSARDFQNVRGQHFLGKSCDTFAPLGPALVTSDEILDPQDLRIETRVNAELRQSASTREMIFPVDELIAFASRLMTLEPGDVILTGTPSGVGAAADPPRWLRDGDVVEIDIKGVGRLRNFVRDERPGP
jgi:acylpyruvate hydrolase